MAFAQGVPNHGESKTPDKQFMLLLDGISRIIAPNTAWLNRHTWLLSLCAAMLYAGNTFAAAPELKIRGANPELLDNIRAYLALGNESCQLGEWRSRTLLREIDSKVRSAGEALGYYHISAQKRLIQNDACWTLSLEITPGEPVRIANISIDLQGDASNDREFAAYLKRLPLRIGMPLNHGAYEEIKSALSTLAAERGYFDARFVTSELKINTGTNLADIVILFDSGRRYRFGNVALEQSILADEFVERYIPFQPGDPYTSMALLEFRQSLVNSRYFAQIDIREQAERADDYHVPITAELGARKRHSYSVGLGAATDTGPRIRFGFEDRYTNPQGHSFTTELMLSPVRSELNFDYRIPLAEPASEHLNLYGGYLEEDTDTSETRTFTVGSRYNLTFRKGWVVGYFLNYQREDFEVSVTEETSRLLIPGLSATRTKSADPVYPLKGFRISGQIRGGTESMVSDASFLQIQGNAKYINKLGPGRILIRLEGGATYVDEFEKLPASIRFFAGGDNSVRGYAYKSLGPLDEEGNVIGGKNLAVHSLEYDYRFGGSNWAAAVFADQGNAFDDDDVIYKRSAGIGLRWLSPIGPIRIDIARALDDERDFRLHLSMGPDL